MMCVEHLRQKWPCGKCGYCLLKRRNEWVFRLQYEHGRSDTAIFTTMTYSDEHLPEHGSLSRKDVRGFLKRFKAVEKKHDPTYQMKVDRKREALKISHLEADKIKTSKYYVIGEYGCENGRPHYHGIFFNLHPRVVARFHETWSKPYQNEEIGWSSVLPVLDGGIKYVAGYFLTKAKEVPDHMEKPFSLVSNFMGKSFQEECNKVGDPLQIQLSDGRVIPTPRYYRLGNPNYDPQTSYWDRIEEIEAEARERFYKKLKDLDPLDPFEATRKYRERLDYNNQRLIRMFTKNRK